MSADERVEALAKVLAEAAMQRRFGYRLTSFDRDQPGVMQRYRDAFLTAATHDAEHVLASGVVAQPATVDEVGTGDVNAGFTEREVSSILASARPHQHGGTDAPECTSCTSSAAPARDGLAEAVRGLADVRCPKSCSDTCRHWTCDMSRRLAVLRAILAEHGATSS